LVHAARVTFPARFTNLDEARRQYGDRVDRLGGFLTRVDPLADDVVASFETTPGGWQLFERAAAHGIASVPKAPDSLRALFDAVSRAPLWVDWETVDRGGEVLMRAGALGGLVLAYRSLVLGYASPAGNKPLVLSGRLEQQAARRINETARFVQATITPGAMRPHGEAWQITLKVRLIHAHVRRMIRRQPGLWDEAWGAPINQHDQAGTSLLFSVAVLDGLRELGVRIGRANAEAYMHLWRWSGWLMGVDPELLPATESEGMRLGYLIHATEGPPDDDSRRLTRALLEAPLRVAKTPRERANALRAVQFGAAMCRALIPQEMADHLAVPHTPWRYVVPLVRQLVSSMERVRTHVPLCDVPAMWAGTRYWNRVVAEGLADGATFGLPKGLAHAA
jgi:hypothetical protein